MAASPARPRIAASDSTSAGDPWSVGPCTGSLVVGAAGPLGFAAALVPAGASPIAPGDPDSAGTDGGPARDAELEEGPGDGARERSGRADGPGVEAGTGVVVGRGGWLADGFGVGVEEGQAPMIEGAIGAIWGS